MASDQLQTIQQHITAGRFDEALAGLDVLLEDESASQEALYMRAVCLRYLKRFAEAHDSLQQLKQLAPEHGRAHQEEGHLMRDSGNLDAAVIAYRRACQYNPALIAAWQALADLLDKLSTKNKTTNKTQPNTHNEVASKTQPNTHNEAANKTQSNTTNKTTTGAQPNTQREAIAVKAQLNKLKRLPKPVLAAMDLIAQGKLLKAEDLLRQFLRRVPSHVEAMRLLADIGTRLGVLDDAEYLLESACEFEPNNHQARIDYVQTLRKRQKFAAAKHQAKLLLSKSPDNPSFLSLYAVESMHSGDFDTALTMFDKALAALPGDPVALTSRGHACKTMGSFDTAVQDYRAALNSQPAHGEAYYSLANLKTYRFQDDEITAMRRQADSANLSHLDRVYLAFALGKACEDRGEFEESFQHYTTGNQLKKTQSRYSAEQMTQALEAQMQVCSADFFAARQGYGHQAPDPIFILGLPRAGSTLLEQILASHSQVDGTLELPNILALTRKLGQGKKIAGESSYPDVLMEVSAADCERFGAEYLHDTRIHRQSAPCFIDKMPNNFRHIGLIKLILPNAKIIDARRHPMACCFSGFKQLFAEGQEFTYSLSDIGTYYQDYIRLMTHWNQTLPNQILTVHHEEVVNDLESQVKRILDYCGLPFEQACLNYHETKRNIRTPSSEQVRQPIFKSSLNTWKNFEPWLTPLKEALGQDIRTSYQIE